MKVVKIRDNQTSFLIEMTNFFLFFLSKKKFNFEKMVARAQKKAGHYDWGSNNNFKEAAALLFKDINENSKLTGFGKYFANELLTMSLTNLFQIERYTQNQNIELEHAPVIILGLPRTGSTFLFNVMARDPNFRSLNFWESSSYSPDVSPLKKKILGWLQLESTHWYAPQLRVIHEMRFEGPGECTHILTNSMKNISFGCFFHLPEYAPWVIKQNQEDTYLNHKKQLWLLGKKDRWLLKSPMHITTFKDMMKVYPNAKVIQLHRDPVDVVGSASSLISASKNLFTKQPVLKPTGKDISKLLQWSLDKTHAERQEIKPKYIVDIYYKELIDDPIKTLKKIYTTLELPWSSDLENIFHQERNQSQQNKFGKHIYDLKDYGLSKELIRDKYQTYIKNYNL